MTAPHDPASLRQRIADRLPPVRRHGPGPAERGTRGTIAPRDSPKPPGDRELLLTLNAEMNRRLDEQWSTVNQLDTKAGLLLTLALTVAGIVLTGHRTPLSFVTLAACVVAIWLNLNCLSVRPWSNAPAPDILVGLEETDPARTYDGLIRAKVASFDLNQQQLARKADWLKISTWWMLLPMVLAAASIVSEKAG